SGHRPECVFAMAVDADRARLVELRACVLGRDDVVGFLTDRRGHATAARFYSRARLVARQRFEFSGEDELLALESLVRLSADSAARNLGAHARLAQTVAQIAVALVVEPVAHRLRDGQTDLVYVVNLFDRRGGQAFERAEVAGEQSRGALADVAYAEAVDELRQVALFARLDLRDEIRRGLLRL